jgi:hypothetical protein
VAVREQETRIAGCDEDRRVKGRGQKSGALQ